MKINYAIAAIVLVAALLFVINLHWLIVRIEWRILQLGFEVIQFLHQMSILVFVKFDL